MYLFESWLPLDIGTGVGLLDHTAVLFLVFFNKSPAGGKESAYQCRRHKRHRFNPWVRMIPWRREWQRTPVFLPEKNPMAEEPVRLQSMGSQKAGTRLSGFHYIITFLVKGLNDKHSTPPLLNTLMSKIEFRLKL